MYQNDTLYFPKYTQFLGVHLNFLNDFLIFLFSYIYGELCIHKNRCSLNSGGCNPLEPPNMDAAYPKEALLTTQPQFKLSIFNEN